MIVVKITLNILADKHLEVTQTLLSLIEPVGRIKGVSYDEYIVNLS